MGNANSLGERSESFRSLKRSVSSKREKKDEKSPSDVARKDDKYKDDAQGIIDAIEVDADALVREARKEELRKAWTRDELYSPQWLCAIATKHELVDEESMKIVYAQELDVFLVKKLGQNKLEELGISEASAKNLVTLAAGM